MKKLATYGGIALALVASFLLFDTNSAYAAELFSWTSTGSNIVVDPAGGQNYTNGYGGGCSSNCDMTASGDVHGVTLKFKSETTRGNINITILDDTGAELDCQSSDYDTTGLSDGDTIRFAVTGTQCNVLENDIQGIKFNLGAGSSASNITWYGGADGSAVGKIYQVWDDGASSSPTIEFTAFATSTVSSLADFLAWQVDVTNMQSGYGISIFYYGITATAAIEVSITHELERIDIIKAKRQRVRKKRLTPTPTPFRGDVLSAEVWERQKKLLTPTPTPPTP